MMPLIGWHHEGFDGGLLVQLQFAKSPEELAKGDLGVVQLAVSPEQAIDFADDLMRMANRVLALQERKTARA